MGLDQYLYASKYVSPNLHRENDRDIYNEVLSLTNAANFVIDEFPSMNIEVKVYQWRKANAIHQFFVDNCQNGEDDCRETYVDRSNLSHLVSLCERVLADRGLADELLPTSNGFFFGSTDYNEYYYQELEMTKTDISKLLETVPSDWDFYYNSSW